MSNSFGTFGQSYFGQSVFGQASNADTTPPSSFSFGNTTGAFQANTSVFSSTPTLGTSASASVPGASGPSVGMFGAPSIFGPSTNSSSNSYTFGSSIGGPKFGETSNNYFGLNLSSDSTASADFRRSAFSFGVSSGPSTSSTSPSLGGGFFNTAGNLTTVPATGTTTFSFNKQSKGSRIVAYSATKSTESPHLRVESLSAMQVYNDKSHEELRLEDYNAGDRGHTLASRFPSQDQSSKQYTSQFPYTQPTFNNSFTPKTPNNPQTPINPFTPKTPNNLFPPQAPINPFAPKTPNNLFPPQAPISSFAPKTPNNLFPPQAPINLFPLQAPINPLAPKTPNNLFPPQTPDNTSAPQTPSSTTCPPTSFTFPVLTDGFSTITLPKSPSSGFLFPQLPSTTCPPANPSFTFSPPPVGQYNPPPPFASWASFSTNSANAGAQIPSLSTPLVSMQTTTNLQSSAEVIGPSTSSQGPASQSIADQPVIKASPFGELPAISHLSISQYGISSMPVKDKPCTPVRLSSLLTSRHLSHHRMRLPTPKYDSKTEGPKVPFFNKDEESPCVWASTLVPRENPRAFVVPSAEVWPHRSETEEISPSVNVSLYVNGEGISSENSTKKEEPSNVLNKDPHETDDSHEARISKEDEIEALMPQLSLPDYYTEPSITQLAEKEKAEPGFCSRVIDFEIGRCGYGNIKFTGETDVRNLSLDSLVEFNTREVVVYKNEKEKPPVGKGLNKQAEVTLLNIVCVDKNTGKKYMDGPKVDKYKEMLIKKGEKQGVEFISFDPVKGEWKFKVQHF